MKAIFRIKFIFILTSYLFYFCVGSCSAGILSNWEDAKAYKPEPILFLHGLNSSSATWASTISALSPLFSKYQPLGTYLETIDFTDKTGSINTYSDGSDGWADKLNIKIAELLAANSYGGYSHKLNLVCHSMGGLTAREYLTNSKYLPADNVDKLILVGVPNLGSPLAPSGQSLIATFKIGSMATYLPTYVCFFTFRNTTNSIAQIVWIPDLKLTPAFEDLTPDSNFLNNLNNRSQPPEVKYYGIYGIVGHILNSILFQDFYGGDGVVSKRSQLGTDRLSFYDSPVKIEAFHVDEPTKSVAGDNPLLKFLDSTKPEFEITYPGSGTTEIYESSIRIQGKVYKEYLPAGTELIITITRQEDGYTLLPQNSLLKPSDLWIPNNSDSPVAEFDETVVFPGAGTYKISTQLKNPAGIISDVKDIFVKVTIFSGTNIIVHCHNPEGKEIAGIEGIGNPWWGIKIKIYDGDRLIGYGAHNAKTHNRPIPASSGTHTIKAEFNGMVKEQAIELSQNETKVIIFTFDRTEITTVPPSFSVSRSISGSGHQPGGGTREHITLIKDGDPPNYLEYYCYTGTPGALDFTWEVDASYELNGWGFQFESYAYVYVISSIWGYDVPSTNGIAQVSVPCNFSIPESQGFTYWFSQGIYSGGDFSSIYGPAIYANSYDVIAPHLYGSSGYGISLLRTNKSYTNVRFEWYYMWGWFDFYKSDVEHTNNQSWGPTILSNFKISSVPYDLTGTAV